MGVVNQKLALALGTSVLGSSHDRGGVYVGEGQTIWQRLHPQDVTSVVWENTFGNPIYEVIGEIAQVASHQIAKMTPVHPMVDGDTLTLDITLKYQKVYGKLKLVTSKYTNLTSIYDQPHSKAKGK